MTGEVAGIGNVFARDGDEERAWGAAARRHGRSSAAYPWSAGRRARASTPRVAAGCERLGPLSVWLK